MSEMRRYALAASAMRMERVGNHIAVFNAASFETHLVNEAAGALLQALAEAPRTSNELADLLTELVTPDERAHAPAHAHDTLARLESLGLVDCVSST